MIISSSVSFLATCLLLAAVPADAFEAASSSPSTNRRDFLLATGSSAAGAGIGSAALLGGETNAALADDAAANAATRPAATAVALGGGIELPKLGLGAWAWGDSVFWGYDKKNDGELKEVFDYAVEKDLAFFDTAEVYGFGRSETLLGGFRETYPKEEADRVRIASKFAAFPFRTKAKDVVEACRKSVDRLGGDRAIDLYQIHFPNAWSNAEYWDGLAMAYEEGLVKAVGVSNYGVDATRAAHSALAERGIKLATNQIQYSLLYRWPEENGLLDACKELDVKVLSYSPLALGFLTGKYSATSLPTGPRKKLGEKLFESGKLTGLLEVMTSVSANHGDAPLPQVAINWARAKHTVPIPGARSLRQAKQNLGALDWSLTAEEIRLLDDASAKVPAYISPDKSPFPKKDINTGLVLFDS